MFITHIHGDHCYGLPGLLASAAMSGRTQPLTLVAPKGVYELIQAVVRTTDLHLNFELVFVDVASLEETLDFQHFQVAVQPLSHRVPSFAFSFQQWPVAPGLDKDKLLKLGLPQGPLWGQLARGEQVIWQGEVLDVKDYQLSAREPKKVVIAGDNDTPELLREMVQGAQLLVHEATYTQDVADKVGPGPQHSAAKTVADFAESCGLPHLILTHFSPRYQEDESISPSIADVRREASESYNGSLFLAQDLEVYCIDSDSGVGLA